MRTVAEMDADIRVAIEYKTKEPRTHISLRRRRRARWSASQQLGRDDVGIVVDLGHSLFAKEAPADALSLVHEHGRLFTIEVNDNWREWDDDLTVGSVHLIETLEFFLEVRKIGWEEPILLDQFPFREDPVEAARTSIHDDARDRRARSTASTSTRCATRRSARTRSPRSACSRICCSATSRRARPAEPAHDSRTGRRHGAANRNPERSGARPAAVRPPGGPAALTQARVPA